VDPAHRWWRRGWHRAGDPSGHAPQHRLTESTEDRSHRGRRLSRYVLYGIAGLVVVFAIGLIIDLLRIRADLDRGQHRLSDLDIQSIDQDGGLAKLAGSAAGDLDRADRTARRSPFLKLLAPLPVIGDQVGALRDLTGAARQLGDLGRTAAQRVQTGLDAAKESPQARVALLDTVVSALTDIKQGIKDVDVGAKGSLLPPLSSAREQLVDRLAKQDPKLDDAIRLSTAMRSFLVGPSKYLILGGNNAEMRALGIATTSGVANIIDGSIKVSDFYDVNVVNIPEGVPMPQELVDLYTFLNINAGYENTVMTPNFPTAASIASAVSEKNPIGPIDGVIFTDTVTLQTLLGVVGPVTVDGITYDGATAASELINKSYLRYQTLDVAPERRKGQSEVAKAIFDAVNTRSYSITHLASIMSDLAKSRHLLAWAKDPAVNELWQKIGASGATTADSFVINPQELGASKLDYYNEVSAKMTVRTIDGGDRRVNLDVTLTNPTKDDPTSPYILGGSLYVQPGDYGFFLAISMPKSARDFVNPEPIARKGTDGPLQVLAIADHVPVGESRTEHFEFTLPPSQRYLEILPSTRLRTIVYEVNGEHFTDIYPKKLDLDEITRPEPSKVPTAASAGALLLADVVLLVVILRDRRRRRRVIAATPR
jgi:hypothetical protein